MLATTHVEVVAETIRDRPASRCVVELREQGSVVVMAAGIGLPRLWGVVARAVVDGFTRAYDSSKEQGRARIDVAVAAARTNLTHTCDRLIERMTPDAGLTAVMLLGEHLHVINAGTGRVYVHREGAPKRLTNRDEAPVGLLRASPVHSSQLVSSGDLIIAGTETAFSTTAVEKLASTLEAAPQVSPTVVTNLLVDPARQAGRGAAAAALRVH